MITCSCDKTIKIWDYSNNSKTQLLFTLEGHTCKILDMILWKNGVSCGKDNMIRIWNLQEKKCQYTLKQHISYLYRLIELPNLLLLSGSVDKSLHLWDLNTIDNNS